MSKQGVHSPEMGVLVSIWKICCRAQIKLKCESIIYIANNKRLNFQHNKPELNASAAEHNIDIICVQTHRYYLNQIEIKQRGSTFFSVSAWKNFVNAAVGDIKMHLSSRVLKSSSHIYPTLPLGQDMTQGEFFSEV